MRYINLRFTYLLTYLLTSSQPTAERHSQDHYHHFHRQLRIYAPPVKKANTGATH